MLFTFSIMLNKKCDIEYEFSVQVIAQMERYEIKLPLDILDLRTKVLLRSFAGMLILLMLIML